MRKNSENSLRIRGIQCHFRKNFPKVFFFNLFMTSILLIGSCLPTPTLIEENNTKESTLNSGSSLYGNITTGQGIALTDYTNQEATSIKIVTAEHLDQNRTFLANITEAVIEEDGSWSETIYHGEYIRVQFESPLNAANDITIIARSQGQSIIEVYARDNTTLLTAFQTITIEQCYQVFLTNLTTSQITFDLKTLGDPVEYDYILDPTGWVSPTGYADPSNQWSTETRAYDENTGTYASHIGALGWQGYLQLNLNSAIYCDRVRVYADFDPVYVDKVSIDVYNSTSWIEKYNGTISDSAWDEVEFTGETNITKARFRYHYIRGSVYLWFYEFDFWQGKPHTLPNGTTLNATSIDETTVVLKGNITDDGGEPCEYRFQYGLTQAYDTNTSWSGSEPQGAEFGMMIHNLVLGNTYEYRVQVRNDVGDVNGSNKNFTTARPSLGWVSPTSHYDPNSKWASEINCYEDEIDTCTQSYHAIGSTQWGSFLYLNHSALLCDQVRFFARGPTGDAARVDQVDLDVLRGAVWYDIFNGTFSDKQWVEKKFMQGNITSARLRFRVNDANSGLNFELYEFDFNNSRPVPRLINEGPTNRSWGVVLRPQLNITVSNPDGAPMTISWSSNSSGSWQIFGVNSSVGNGTYHQWNNNFSSNNTKYWWKIFVSDGIDSNSSSYYFSAADFISPSSSVNAVIPYWKKVTSTIAATATDTGWSGLKNVTLYYRFSSDNSSWGGWVSAGVDSSAPWSWNFSFSNSTGYYQFYSIAVDNASNTELAPGGFDAKSGYEALLPSSSVSVVTSYWKTTSPQLLNGMASDTGPSGLKNVTLRYRYRTSNTSTWGGWVNSGLVDSDPWVAVSWSFSFSNGSGYYEFYSIARDNATNAEDAPGSADTSCGFDNQAPTSSITDGILSSLGGSTYEWNPAEGRHPAVVRLGSSEYYLIAAEGDLGGGGSTYDGWLYTIRVWSNNGTIQKSLINSWEYDSSDGFYPSICLVNGSSNVYAITYEDAGSTARKIITTRVWDNNGTLQKTILDTLSLSRSTITSYSKIINVQGNIYAVAYVNSSDGDGRLATCYIDGGGSIGNTVNDTLEFNSSDALNPQLCLVDDDTIAIVYDGGTAGGNDGYLVTYNISSTGDITNTRADQWEFDPTMGTTPNIYKVWADSENSGVNWFVIGYEDANSDLYVKTCTINDSGRITKVWTDTQALDTTNGDACNFASIGYDNTYASKLMLCGFSGEGSDGYVSSFDVTNAGVINAKIGSIEFDAVDCISRPWFVNVDNTGVWMVVYEGTGNDGWSGTFFVRLNGVPYWKTSSPFPIYGVGSDNGPTGMKNITLWYRYQVSNSSNWGEWVRWSDASNPDLDPWAGISWGFTFPNGSGFYQFYSIGSDNVSNIESSPASADFLCGFDMQAPASSVDTFANYWTNVSSVSVNVTASDVGIGVKNVTLYSCFSPNNASWQGWMNLGTDTTVPWSWDFSFSNGTGYYEFYSVGVDFFNNTETMPAGCDSRVCYDPIVPSSAVNAMSPYWKRDYPVDITGSASDSGGSGLHNVTLWYRFSATNLSWETWVSSGFVDSIPWSGVSWLFPFSNGSGYYQFYSIAVDNATGVESGPGVADALCGFDSSAPTSSVNTISDYWHKAAPLSITATAGDELSGIKNVTLCYRFSSDNSSWDGNTSFAVDTTAPWSWSFPFSNGSGYYRFYCIAADNASNTESAPFSADTWCGFDDILPSSSVNPIAPYWLMTGPLTITATADDDSSGIKQTTLFYRFSEDNETWGAWLSLGEQAAPYTWNFSFNNGSGYYQLYSTAEDNASNTEDFDGIDTCCGFDTAAPTSYVLPLPVYWTNVSTQNLTVLASDPGSGLKNITLYYRYHPVNSSWGSWMPSGLIDTDPWNPVIFAFDFINGSGHYEFSSIARDNESLTEPMPESADASCGYDNDIPESTLDPIQPYVVKNSPYILTASIHDATSGIATVDLWYRFRPSNTSLWGAWIMAGQSSPEPSTVSWSMTFRNGTGNYEFYSLAHDKALNQEAPLLLADIWCRYEPVQTRGTYAPRSLIPHGTTYWHAIPSYLPVIITRIQTTIKSVQYYYRFSLDNVSWDGWTTADNGATSPWSILFEFPNGSGYYQFYSRAVDDRNLLEIKPPIAELWWGYDHDAPESTISLFQNQTQPFTLTTTTHDIYNSIDNIILWYRFSTDNISWSSWQLSHSEMNQNGEWNFNFPNSSGYYEFYTIAIDSLGNREPIPLQPDVRCYHVDASQQGNLNNWLDAIIQYPLAPPIFIIALAIIACITLKIILRKKRT